VRRVLSFVVASSALALVGAARAQETRGAKPDSTYGRLDGDVALVAGAGLAVGPRSPRATAEIRVRYLETAGLFFTYEDGKALGGGSEPIRVLSGGLELRPLFMGRWLTGRESGKARLDLMVDSLAIELGGFFEQPIGGSLGQRPGFQAGLGLEIPILAAASGPWIGLHGGLRWSDGTLGGDPIVGPADRAAFLSITVAWHQIVGTHVVDVGDRSLR
jgi:hypothetical protein